MYSPNEKTISCANQILEMQEKLLQGLPGKQERLEALMLVRSNYFKARKDIPEEVLMGIISSVAIFLVYLEAQGVTTYSAEELLDSIIKNSGNTLPLRGKTNRKRGIFMNNVGAQIGIAALHILEELRKLPDDARQKAMLQARILGVGGVGKDFPKDLLVELVDNAVEFAEAQEIPMYSADEVVDSILSAYTAEELAERMGDQGEDFDTMAIKACVNQRSKLEEQAMIALYTDTMRQLMPRKP